MNDAGRLCDLLRELRSVLAEIARAKPEPPPPAAERGDTTDAETDPTTPEPDSEESTPSPLELYADAWETVDDRFDAVDAEIRSGRHAVALRQRGLTGGQLALVHDGFFRCLDAYRKAPSRTTLGQVLRWADIPLGTLGGIVDEAVPIAQISRALERVIE